MGRRLMTRVEVRTLPADGHQKPAGVDHLAHEAPGHANDPRGLQTLDGIRDALAAKPCGGHQDNIGRGGIAVLGANEAQDERSKHPEANLADDAVAGARRPCPAFQSLGKGKDAGSFISIKRAAMLAPVHDEARRSSVFPLHAEAS
jgi:hypothetical protein